MHGFSCPGHFADYSISDYRNAMVLPDGIDMISAAPLFCAGVTGRLSFLTVHMFRSVHFTDTNRSIPRCRSM